MFEKKVLVYLVALLAAIAASLSLEACAGERQGLVCSEIQYRLDTQTYSPDQRAYIEEELRVCREEEAKKRGEDAAARQGIYERYAATQDSAGVDSTKSVSEAIGYSSGEATISIYDRYKMADSSADSAAGAVAPAAGENDTASVDAGAFQ
jgi:hypothetical protein